MNARANTRVSILRGTTTDEFDDEADTLAVLKTGVPASVIPVTRRVYLPAEGAHRVVHTVTGRMSGSEPAPVKDDRWRDDRTQQVYLVTEVRESPTLGNIPDHVVELQYTN